MARRRRRFLTNAEIEEASEDELVLWFQPLAGSIAAKIRPGCEDTVADAYFGLVRAAQHYDPNKGPFYAYATLWIRQAITRGSSGQRHSIWLPPEVRSRLATVLAARDQVGPDATSVDIARALGEGWDEGQVARLIAVPQVISADSVPRENSSEALITTFPDQRSEDDYDAMIARSDLEAILEALPPDLAVSIQQWIEGPESQADLRRIATAVRSYLEGDTML